MATRTINALKIFSNVFRSKMTLSYESSELYKPLINRHKDTLIELIKEKAEKAVKSEIARKMRVAKGFYTLEMAPPTSGNEMQRLRADLNIAKEFFKTGCFRYLTVKQAWLLLLVVTEIGLWFFLGETIGKMHIVGYKV